MLDRALYMDNRNAALWEEVNHSDLILTIEESDEPNYKCYYRANIATIYVLPSKPDPASFAHELLHVKMFVDGITAGCCLKRTIQEHPVLKDIITLETIDVITNCMDHVKMLPQFLAMGYSNSEFIDDYNSYKMNLTEFIALCRLYIKNQKHAMDRFLGTYCAMRADSNPKHKYNTYFMLMRRLNKPLFEIVERFWNQWLQYDTEKQREIWEPDYGPIISNFVNELGNYFSKGL